VRSVGYDTHMSERENGAWQQEGVALLGVRTFSAFDVFMPIFFKRLDCHFKSHLFNSSFFTLFST
jgi:hypothetical protein